MNTAVAGPRVRQLRTRAGLSQKALAAAAGISPSYLNLIEHNRRVLAGRVLLSLARALGVPPASLTGGAEQALLAELRAAAAAPTGRGGANDKQGGQQGGEVADSAEDLIGRFPDWAHLLAGLYRRTRDQQAAILALSDRLTHDPFLAESLHLMLSKITAIRSTAGILTSVEDIPPVQRSRFLRIVHEESRHLSDVATGLTAYFDRAAEDTSGSATPEEELDTFLDEAGHHFPDLDLPPQPGEDTAARIARILAQASGLGRAAQARAGQILRDYAADATALPLPEFSAAVRALGCDPAALAAQFGTSALPVLRRLAHLRRPELPDAPECGLVVVNAAGQTLLRRPLASFPVPRHGHGCARWPLFQALAAPGQMLVRMAELPGPRSFVTIALAQASGPAALGQPPDIISAMLILPAGSAAAVALAPAMPASPVQIGTTCRLCPREACPARAEPQILT